MLDQQRIALIDIDGTLADISHRLHHIQNAPKNWEAFHNECVNDKPIQKMIDIVNNLYDNYEIILITGRMERNRNNTLEWLAEQELAFDKLYMRPDGNYKQDYVIKYALLTEDEIKRVAFAIDDRNQVVTMWRDMGILTLQCADGDF